MRHLLQALLVVLAAIVLLGFAPLASAQQPSEVYPHHPGRVLVKFKAHISRAQAAAYAADAGLEVMKVTPITGIHIMKIKGTQSVKDMIEALKKNPEVEYAEPDYEVHALAIFPDDPSFPSQWALHNTGQTGGTADADIDAPEAWDLQTSASSIVVALIDTGVDYTHEDLAANMWTNSGEIPGDGLDNDGNGFIDDIHGYDFFNDDGDPMDINGHGTLVAGVIGAIGNNATGVVGITWDVQLMAVKILDQLGNTSASMAILAIEYATLMGAKILNNSWGGSGPSQALKDSITATDSAGILFVTGAGNAGKDNDLTPVFPANFDVPNVVAVAATDHTDTLGASNWGKLSVDLAAPGVQTLNTVPGNSYRTGTGTSLSAPHVSGAAALLWAHLPGLSHRDVKSYLMSTVDPLTGEGAMTFTGGRLNINNALRCDTTALKVIPGPPLEGFTVDRNEATLIKAMVSACSIATGATVIASFDNGDLDVTLLDDGVSPDDFANDGVYSGQWIPGFSGSVSITIDASKEGLTSDSALISGTVISLLPPVSVTTTPDSTTIVRGSNLGYQVTLTNNTSSRQTFQFWTNITLPNGNTVPVGRELVGPVTVTLGPNASRSAHISHFISGGASLGTYTYHGYVGPYPTVGDQSNFAFDVVSP